MNKLSQTFEDRKPQQTPRPADCDAEGRCDKAALSDEELAQVSGAGEAAVPTMEPEVLLGRHARPTDPKKNNP